MREYRRRLQSYLVVRKALIVLAGLAGLAGLPGERLDARPEIAGIERAARHQRVEQRVQHRVDPLEAQLGLHPHGVEKPHPALQVVAYQCGIVQIRAGCRRLSIIAGGHGTCRRIIGFEYPGGPACPSTTSAPAM